MENIHVEVRWSMLCPSQRIFASENRGRKSMCFHQHQLQNQKGLSLTCKLKALTSPLMSQTRSRLFRIPRQDEFQLPCLLERAPRRLLDFSTCWCAAYLRAALIRWRRLFKTAYMRIAQSDNDSVGRRNKKLVLKVFSQLSH